MNLKMLWRCVLLLALVFASQTPAYAQPPINLGRSPVTAPPKPDVMKFKGAGVMMYGNWGDTEVNTAEVLDRIKANGGNSVSLVFPFFQESFTATQIYTDTELTPSDDQLRTWFRLAHARKMSVLLRPIMDEQNLTKDGRWRGNIAPTDVGAWFQNYTIFLLHYAVLAEEEKVELFSIGAELNSLERYTANWTTLINDVRAVYSGKLIYSANWGVSQRVRFWNQIDFIGLDAFFNLDAPDGASVEELVATWQTWVIMLRAQATALGKPLLFTEIGVQSAAGSYREPWRWVPNAVADQQDQANYYAASCIAARSIPIHGLYWWAIGRELPEYLSSPEATAQNRDHNFIGKLAEKEVSNCFKYN